MEKMPRNLLTSWAASASLLPMDFGFRTLSSLQRGK
jgi:hypothetical protein